jgi:polyisoprenoid-binding protein YceI
MSVTEAATKTVWAIDASHTMAEFGVKHMMVSTTKGRFGNVQGTIELDETDITRSAITVEIDVASIDTHDEKRDGHLKSPDFFDVENHPAMTFVSTKIETGKGDGLAVTGDLTIRGTTLPVVLDVEFGGRGVSPWGTEVIAYTATTSVKISLEVEAVKQ